MSSDQGKENKSPQANKSTSAEHNQNADVAHPLPAVVADLPPTPADDDKADRERSHALEKKKYRVEKITLVILFIYTSVAAYQACLTKRAIAESEESFNKTLGEMKAQTTAQQGTATAVASAADIASAALKQSSKSFNEFLKYAAGQRALQQKLVANTKEATEIIRQNAKITAEINVKTIRAEVDPWVSIQNIEVDPKPQVGKPLAVKVTVYNTGRTPSTGARVDGRCYVQQDAIDVLLNRNHLTDITAPPARGTAIVQAEGGHFWVVVECRSVTADEINQIGAGSFPLVVVGDIWYWDVFGDWHHTEFCKRVSRTGPITEDCRQHNGIKQ